MHTSTHHTGHAIPHVVQTKYKNRHNWRPTQLPILNLETTINDVIQPAAGILILGNQRLLNEDRTRLSGKLHTLAGS